MWYSEFQNGKLADKVQALQQEANSSEPSRQSVSLLQKADQGLQKPSAHANCVAGSQSRNGFCVWTACNRFSRQSCNTNWSLIATSYFWIKLTLSSKVLLNYLLTTFFFVRLIFTVKNAIAEFPIVQTSQLPIGGVTSQRVFWWTFWEEKGCKLATVNQQCMLLFKAKPRKDKIAKTRLRVSVNNIRQAHQINSTGGVELPLCIWTVD